MLEDKFETIIKEEVAKAVANLITQDGLEKVVANAVAAAFEPFIRRKEIAAQEYIAEKQVEAIFPIASSTLKTWRNKKMPGPPYYKIGDRIVYKLSDLHDYFDKHRV